MSIGSRVRARRNEMRLSQEHLARRADISLKVVQRLETGGIADPHYTTLTRLAGALGMSLAELVGESEPVAPKAQAPYPQPDAGERRYPYPWMSNVLAETLARWHGIAFDQDAKPMDSYLAANGCFAILQSVLSFDVPGKTLADRVPAEELEERKKFAEWLGDIAEHASKHYADSQDAAPAEVASLEEYRSRLKAGA